MKDAWDNNNMKMVFLYELDTAEDWEMFRYDGTPFSVTGKLGALFRTMEKEVD